MNMPLAATAAHIRQNCNFTHKFHDSVARCNSNCVVIVHARCFAERDVLALAAINPRACLTCVSRNSIKQSQLLTSRFYSRVCACAGPISTTDSYPDDEDNAIIDVEEDYKIPISSISTASSTTTTTTGGSSTSSSGGGGGGGGRRGSKASSLAAPVSPSGSSDEERLSPDSVQVNMPKDQETHSVDGRCRMSLAQLC